MGVLRNFITMFTLDRLVNGIAELSVTPWVLLKLMLRPVLWTKTYGTACACLNPRRIPDLLFSHFQLLIGHGPDESIIVK